MWLFQKIKNTFPFIFCLGLGMFLLAGCGSKDKCSSRPEVPPLAEKIQLIRLEKTMLDFKNKEAIGQFLEKNPLFAQKFLQKAQYPHDSILVNILWKLSEDKNIDTLNEVVGQAFKDMQDVENQLNYAFALVKYYFPSFVVPKVYTVVTGFGHDLYASDSIVVIGLDYFMGDQANYKPDVPNYMLRRFKREYIVPSVMLLISDKFNTTDVLDNTLLAEMMHYGKSYYFVEKTMPCAPDSLVIGYSEKELADTKNHESIVWAHFVEQKLLYETSHFIITKYIGERPYTAEIGSKCPGRIGRWLGWQIIRKYMNEHPEVTLEKLMADKSAGKIFQEAHYKPEK